MQYSIFLPVVAIKYCVMFYEVLICSFILFVGMWGEMFGIFHNEVCSAVNVECDWLFCDCILLMCLSFRILSMFKDACFHFNTLLEIVLSLRFPLFFLLASLLFLCSFFWDLSFCLLCTIVNNIEVYHDFLFMLCKYF